MKFFALLLLAAPIASADTVDVFDYDLGLQSRFTSCEWVSYNKEAICGARVDVPNYDRMPDIAGYSIIAPTMHYGPFTGYWAGCALTDVHGIGDGVVYHRFDCAPQAILRIQP